MDEGKCQILAKCRTERFQHLVHGVIDKMLGRSGPSYREYADVWELEEWWTANDAIQDVCKECGKHDMDREQVQKAVAGVSEKLRDILINAVLFRKNELHEILLARTTAITGKYLSDFDWKLKLVLSSDKLATVREPLVSVDFSIKSHEGSQPLSVELNKDDLKKLVLSLESANKALTQLKT